MKRKMWSAMALAGAMFWVGSAIAEAADVKISGEVMSRWEHQDRDFNDKTNANNTVDSRVRVNFNVNLDEKVSAYIETQGIRSWGQAHPSDNSVVYSSENVNDRNASMGLHQGYFTVKNLYSLPVDLQFGRQELILDGHRLFGDTLWTMGEQSHDGFRLTHRSADHEVLYFFSRVQHTDAHESANVNTNHDTQANLHVVYGNFKGILGGGLSLYWAYLDDSRVSTVGQNKNDFHTAGFRQAGQLAGIDYRAEFYYQWGSSETNGNGWDRDAYMFGVRAGKNFGGSLNPTFTLWYDYLSGTSSSDINNKKNSSFDTLFDTGHKYYGLMDMWLNIGQTSRGSGGANGTTAVTGSGGSRVQADSLRGLGLRDLAFKASVTPFDNWKLDGDLHVFWTAEDYYSSSNFTTVNSGNVGKSHLGEELDLTLTHKYTPNLSLIYGYSYFWASDLMRELPLNAGLGSASITAGADNAKWAYLMMHLKF